MSLLPTANQTNGASFLITLHTLFVATFFDIKSLNYALVYGGFIGEGAMAVLYPSIVACVFSVSIIRSKFVLNSITPYALFLILYIHLLYIITNYFIGPPHVTYSLFMVLVVCSFLIPQVSEVNVRLLIKLIMCMPFFSVFRINEIFGITGIWLNEISMDASYSFLLPIIANIVYLKFYFENEKRFTKLISLFFSFINCLFLGYILTFGSRAPILSILLLFFFWYIFKKNTIGLGVKVQKNRVIVLIILITFISFSGHLFITWLVSFLESYGLSISALNKIILLGDNGDVTNGRNELYNWAISGFLENPILGNGLDRFDAKYPGADYPHNFVLQALYDGGLFLTIVLLYPIALRVKSYLNNCSIDEYAIFSVLFFASVPGALFSQDLWGNAVLWLFFGLLFSKRFVLAR